MTKDEYRKIALHGPTYSGKSIFKVTQLLVPIHTNLYSMQKNGEFGVKLDTNGEHYFSSFELAESGVKDLHEICSQIATHSVYRTLVEQLQLDEINGGNEVAWFLYDDKDRMIDHSVYERNQWQWTENLYGKYLGRSEDAIRFKRGDIAEIAVELPDGSYIAEPVMVTGVPSTVDFMWEVNKVKEKMEDISVCPGNEYYSLLRISGDWISVSPRDIRTPILPVPDQLTEMLKWQFTTKYGVQD